MTRRYVCHAVLHDGKVYRNAVLTLGGDGRFEITPFTTECHSTRFFNGYILLAARPISDITCHCDVESLSRMMKEEHLCSNNPVIALFVSTTGSVNAEKIACESR